MVISIFRRRQLGLLRRLHTDLGVLGDPGIRPGAGAEIGRADRRHDRPGRVDEVDDRGDDRLGQQTRVVGGGLVGGGAVEHLGAGQGAVVAHHRQIPVGDVLAGRPVLDRCRRLPWARAVCSLVVDLAGPAAGLDGDARRFAQRFELAGELADPVAGAADHAPSPGWSGRGRPPGPSPMQTFDEWRCAPRSRTSSRAIMASVCADMDDLLRERGVIT